MAIRMEPSKTGMVTRELVEKFLNMEKCRNQRAISERRLKAYRELLKEEMFLRPVEWVEVYCKETNTTYIANGNHTVLLMSEMLPDLPAVEVTLQKYECDTLKGVSAVYNMFDSRTASRTSEDVNQSVAGSLPELSHLSKKMVNLVVGAIGTCEWGSSKYMGTASIHRANLLYDNVDFAVWLHDLFSSDDARSCEGRKLKPLIRIPVCAAICRSYRQDEVKAAEFWGLVISHRAPQPEHITRKLAEWLSIKTLSGGGRGTSTEKISWDSMQGSCEQSWNRWINGDVLVKEISKKLGKRKKKKDDGEKA